MTLFRPLKFTGEKIVHHQCRDESRDTKILLWIVIQDVQVKLVASVSKPREKFVDREFLFICPLGNRVQQSASSPAKIRARFHSRLCSEELSQISVVKMWIGIFVELSFARVISFELYVETIVIGDAILRRVHRRHTHQ